MSPDNDITRKAAVILLAAGASKRLGAPKQFLSYEGQTLLEYSLQVAINANTNPVIVILGHDAEKIKRTLHHNSTHIFVNYEWQEGMASSIRFGIQKLLEIDPHALGVILMVCDQPFIDSALLNTIITAQRDTGKKVIASSYANTFGPPVYFDKSFFNELLQLKGDVGARGIIQKYIEDVQLIPFPKGDVDIDTSADYERLSRDNSGLS